MLILFSPSTCSSSSGRADQIVHLSANMDNRSDRRNDELCPLKPPRLHLCWSHHQQEACCRLSNTMYILLLIPIILIMTIITTTGVINCPLVGLCYTAVRGKGSFCNGKRLKTSGCKDLSKVDFKIAYTMTNPLKHFQNYPTSHQGDVDHGAARGCQEGEEGGGAEQPLCDHGHVGSNQHHHYHHHHHSHHHPHHSHEQVGSNQHHHYHHLHQCHLHHQNNHYYQSHHGWWIGGKQNFANPIAIMVILEGIITTQRPCRPTTMGTWHHHHNRHHQHHHRRHGHHHPGATQSGPQDLQLLTSPGLELGLLTASSILVFFQ